MSWETEQQILSRVNLVLAKEQQLLELVQSLNLNGLQKTLTSIQDSITQLESGQSTLTTTVSSLNTSLSAQLTTLSANIQQDSKTIESALKKIYQVLIPPPATSFTATITKQGEELMAPSKKATADLQVLDNGTFTVTLGFVDADGVTTATPAGLSATYTASDATPGPSSLTLAPSADTSSCAGSVNQTTIQALVAAGTPLPTGLTVSVSATWTGLASPLTVVANPPIDIVAGPAATFVAT